ncbi:MAG: GDP-mannose 4,6-dehydratase, partial [Oligoflexia bacterium]|nr:GDP-mannose 4,6-dehydratase [Oligoflexia bacterium]
MTKKILVAGGAGFIGSNLCEKLLSVRGNVVVCADNLITGNIENLAGIISSQSFHFVEADICTGDFEKKLPFTDFDEIYN